LPGCEGRVIDSDLGQIRSYRADAAETDPDLIYKAALPCKAVRIAGSLLRNTFKAGRPHGVRVVSHGFGGARADCVVGGLGRRLCPSG
jgi:hypothetical protein